MNARLSLDYHEGSIERLTITIETPTRFDIDEILGALEDAGATILRPAIQPVVQPPAHGNGYAV